VNFAPKNKEILGGKIPCRNKGTPKGTYAATNPSRKGGEKRTARDGEGNVLGLFFHQGRFAVQKRIKNFCKEKKKAGGGGRQEKKKGGHVFFSLKPKREKIFFEGRKSGKEKSIP